MQATIKIAVALILQIVTFGVGVLTTFGVTLDPEMVKQFTDLVSQGGAQVVGIALIFSALSTSAQDLFKRIREQLSAKQ